MVHYCDNCYKVLHPKKTITCKECKQKKYCSSKCKNERYEKHQSVCNIYSSFDVIYCEPSPRKRTFKHFIIALSDVFCCEMLYILYDFYSYVEQYVSLCSNPELYEKKVVITLSEICGQSVNLEPSIEVIINSSTNSYTDVFYSELTNLFVEKHLIFILLEMYNPTISNEHVEYICDKLNFKSRYEPSVTLFSINSNTGTMIFNLMNQVMYLYNMHSNVLRKIIMPVYDIDRIVLTNDGCIRIFCDRPTLSKLTIKTNYSDISTSLYHVLEF